MFRPHSRINTSFFANKGLITYTACYPPPMIAQGSLKFPRGCSVCSKNIATETIIFSRLSFRNTLYYTYSSNLCMSVWIWPVSSLVSIRPLTLWLSLWLWLWLWLGSDILPGAFRPLSFFFSQRIFNAQLRIPARICRHRGCGDRWKKRRTSAARSPQPFIRFLSTSGYESSIFTSSTRKVGIN